MTMQGRRFPSQVINGWLPAAALRAALAEASGAPPSDALLAAIGHGLGDGSIAFRWAADVHPFRAKFRTPLLGLEGDVLHWQPDTISVVPEPVPQGSVRVAEPTRIDCDSGVLFASRTWDVRVVPGSDEPAGDRRGLRWETRRRSAWLPVGPVELRWREVATAIADLVVPTAPVTMPLRTHTGNVGGSQGSPTAMPRPRPPDRFYEKGVAMAEGRRHGGLDYEKHDTVLLPKIHRLLNAGTARSPTEALRILLTEKNRSGQPRHSLAGGGTEASKIKRVVLRYTRWAKEQNSVSPEHKSAD